MFDIDVNELLRLKKELRFGADGKFRILVMSDLHGGVGYSKQVPAAIEVLVADVAPDLVLFNGDVAGPGRIHVETPDQLKGLLDEISLPMESRGIPWCHVFGNHDDNGGVDNRTAEAVYESFPCCVSKLGDESLSGAANYVLPVKACGSDRIVFNVWGLDSHGDVGSFIDDFGVRVDRKDFILPEHFGQGHGYDTVHPDQVIWYYRASRALEEYNGAKIAGLLCCHIPVIEMLLIARNLGETHFEGHFNEDVCCSELNSGLWQACVERGDVRAMCFGHDHVNDFTGVYGGIRLCYDGGLDYDAYQTDEIRGGRLFEINENDPFDIRTRMIRVRDVMGSAGDKRGGRQ